MVPESVGQGVPRHFREGLVLVFEEVRVLLVDVGVRGHRYSCC